MGVFLLRTSIVAQPLAALVDKENVVDQLHGQGLAHARTEAVDDACRHEAVE